MKSFIAYRPEQLDPRAVVAPRVRAQLQHRHDVAGGHVVHHRGLEIALACQQVMGAYGYIKEFDMERYVREALLMPIIGGSSAIQKNNIANRLRLARE